jgi:hypothetical protein
MTIDDLRTVMRAVMLTLDGLDRHVGLATAPSAREMETWAGRLAEAADIVDDAYNQVLEDFDDGDFPAASDGAVRLDA